MKFGQSVEYNMRNHAENEVVRLAPDILVSILYALYHGTIIRTYYYSSMVI